MAGQSQVSAANGNVWTISSPTAGTTVTANYVVSTASCNCLVGVLNPAGAAKALYLTRAVLVVVTGATTVGQFVWGVSPATAAAVITSTGAVACNNTTFLTVTGAHQAKAFAGDTTASVLAGSTTSTIKNLRPFGGPTNGIVPVGTLQTLEEDPTDDIVVAPGCFAGLFANTASVGTVVIASLTWSEGD